MNELSTDLLPEVAEAIEAAKTTLAEREREAEEAQRRLDEEVAAKRREGWAEPLSRLYAALPAWMHPYIIDPQEDYCDSSTLLLEYAPIRIEVPGVIPIAAWVIRTIGYEPYRPYLYRNEDTGVWSVELALHNYRKSMYQAVGETDIAVALFQAHEAMLRSLDLEAVAAERNNPDAEPEPTPEPVDPVTQAAVLLDIYAKDLPLVPGGVNDRDDTILLASMLGAIAHHARRIADALERRQWS